MASGNIPAQRREVVVRGDVNCFYRAIPLWRGKISDEKSNGFRAATIFFELCESPIT